MFAKEKKKFFNGEHIGDYANLGNITLHYVMAGAGETILLVHGIGQTLYTWRNNFFELAENYRVIAVDLAGAGYSSKPDIHYTVEDHLEILKDFLEYLEIEKTHIIGFSTGAVYAFALAAAYPEMVDRIVAISPGGMPQTGSFMMRMLKSRGFGRLASSFLNESRVYKMLSDAFFDKTVLNREIGREYYEPLSTPEAKAALLETIQNLDIAPVMMNLKKIYNPVLIVWGLDDPYHPAETADLFRTPLPNCLITTVRNCGHIVHEEKPDRFNHTVDGFLKWKSAE